MKKVRYLIEVLLVSLLMSLGGSSAFGATDISCESAVLPRLNVDHKLPTHKQVQQVRAFLKSRILGQDDYIDKMLIALLTDGHINVTSQPGAGKTRAGKFLAMAVSGTSGREQFSADLSEAKLIGTKVWNDEKKAYEFKFGSIFTNIFVADEFNRAEHEVTDRLLTIMGDKAVLIDGESVPLPEVFMVIATQNPEGVELGTHPVSNANKDRFMFFIKLNLSTDRNIMKEIGLLELAEEDETRSPVENGLTLQQILEARKEIRQLARNLPEAVVNEILRIIGETREKLEDFEWGAGDRTQGIYMKAVAGKAWIEGRSPTVDDVKELAVPLLAHRVKLKEMANGLDQMGSDASVLIRQIAYPNR